MSLATIQRPVEALPPPVPVRAPRRRLFALAAAVLLAQMAIAMVTTAVTQTPTVDEPVYIGATVVQLQQHSLRYNPEHPPLGKLIMATGLAFADVHLDPGFQGDQTELGRHVLYESGNDPGALLLAARLPMIVLTLLFGVVVLLFARDVTNTSGGLVALALYTFSPDLIAHGSLATLDVPAAGFLLTSAWLLWRARTDPGLYLPLAGLALGAALATKMNTLAAVPVLLFLAFWHARVKAVLVMVLVAVAVVWASYLAVDPLLRWETPPGLPGAPVGLLPFPEPYLDGMRVQLGFENRVWGGYLFGTHYEGSHWYYLPAALLVKTPLGALLLWAAGAVAMVERPAAAYVLAPAAVLLLVAMTGNRDLGVRYAIFVPMFLAVAAAVVAHRRYAALAVVAVAASSLWTFPYYLPYSNEIFGGPSKTHLHLHDSNVDWGQDLGRLAERLKRYSGERKWLVYKGSGVPEHYGISAADPREVPPDQVQGLLVVSNTAIAKADDVLRALIDTSTPIDVVGHSITIFRRP
ncbi:phospholipid carrier-dependent glycosyltransferase [Lentzea flaviverrucosa]|uniref:Dolichyl-phosphate-mannose-protein mannosyltransferase n=1 Tax=Lentzea flaviverrucosa TaxID=200379 RepID=A0A1H9XYX4_9PSEU|nr:phospholipid carrier-dependent glycosyltransferase [Lentzea flaviverrucosa]RDI17045.1 dolichyl-phosphate-mannose-protein mannosyltransferase [Lentzea flaviverrucosa]SES50883.1 Dolichyl-phosphate-mannose-protein mannosyltransferase [Lentzea flaviverrucosa]